MSLIKATNVHKRFKVYQHGDGLKGYVKSFLSRDYNEVHAVKDLNLSIKEGEIVGYIGSNGAGKSTTIKMLTGIMEPTFGDIRVNGRIPHNNRKQNAMDIGVVFGQKTQLWWDLPVKDSLRLLKEMYRVPDEAYQERMDEFRQVLGIEEFMNRPVRKLSLGQKMRCELAASFLHHPKIVYLDEPTIGLDVAVKERIRDFIKKMNREEDITVMLTTHDIGDIEDLCNRIVVLDKGEKIYDGELDALVNRFTSRKLVLDLREPEPFDLSHSGIEMIEQEDSHVEIVFDRATVTASDIMQDALPRYDVVDFQIKEPDIEEVVKTLYNDGLAQVREEQEHAVEQVSR